MDRQRALQILRQALPDLRQRYAVKELALFGSTARDESGPESDVDLLVTFEGPARFRAFMGLQFELEDLLGTRVDLVTIGAVKPALRPRIDRDLIRVA
ncbi:nucleotidyltransferase family protein [Geothrix sp. 21YS21S-4]|uniref:nucleotidyltransferase family protein n=1 Tax=Geothrix sp. 21YS21S-4 TaxID=3068889 RepID=UPI0027BA98CD|nr:nucleotidyltransferase family protein [Geothrix sp. 21YS21S-4]